MFLDIKLRFKPTDSFVGILAELNEQYSQWTDGSYDWANQTVDFLHNQDRLPNFSEALYTTPFSRRTVNDLLQVTIAMLAGNYLAVRNYLQQCHFAFVIGYPRSGGSYLTKELLRTVGLEHTRVSEALAHDGFPDLRDTWYDRFPPHFYNHLQEAIFEVAEFLVIANLYYQRKTQPRENGIWLIPKKLHKMVYWAGSFKMLLGQGRADYLVTVRHPVPTCISIYEKSGGPTEDGLFPAAQPRSAIERWVLNDLLHLGFTLDAVAKMEYFDAVLASWSQFYSRMATSGLFLGDREEIRLVPYGKNSLEEVVSDYRQRYSDPLQLPESFLIHDKAQNRTDWFERGDVAVKAVAHLWSTLGLRFPELSKD